MKCSTEKNSAFILSTQNNHTIASTVATGSAHVWCYHLPYSSVTPKRWISGRKNIWIGIFHSYFLFCLFLLPQAFLGKMLEKRPPLRRPLLSKKFQKNSEKFQKNSKKNFKKFSKNFQNIFKKSEKSEKSEKIWFLFGI